MNFNSLFQFLVPKENKFFPLLRGQVEGIIKVSDLLVDFYNAPDFEVRQEVYALIKDTEKHCDCLTNTIFDELNDTFITPFDREDIHTLADELDDVVDLMNGAAKRAILYRPRTLPPQMLAISELLRKMGESLQIAVNELEKVRKHPEVVKEQCSLLHKIENEADIIYENFLIELFENETDAIELMRQQEVLLMLETATDKAEDAAAVIKRIIVKYS